MMRSVVVVAALSASCSLRSRRPLAPGETVCHTDDPSPVYGNTFVETHCQSGPPVMPAGFGTAAAASGWWCTRNESTAGICSHDKAICDDNADRLNEECDRIMKPDACADRFGRCHHETQAFCASAGVDTERCYTTLAWCQTFQQRAHRASSDCFAK